MRVAITGTTGRVGGMLARTLAARHEVLELPRSLLDLSHPYRIHQVLRQLDFDWLIHPSGLTSPDACEADPALALRLNRDAPGELAGHCARRGAGFLHFSTDYVFGGHAAGHRTECDPADPIGAYGRSKRAGELAALAAHPQCSILRVSWIFGAHKPSFVNQIAAAARAGEPLSAVADKFSLPTRASALCEWVEFLLTHPHPGILHACQSGEPASWHDIAVATVTTLARLGVLTEIPTIRPLPLSSLATLPAPRPRHTAMANHRLSRLLGSPPVHWRDALAAELAAELECR